MKNWPKSDIFNFDILESELMVMCVLGGRNIGSVLARAFSLCGDDDGDEDHESPPRDWQRRLTALD